MFLKHMFNLWFVLGDIVVWFWLIAHSSVLLRKVICQNLQRLHHQSKFRQGWVSEISRHVLIIHQSQSQDAACLWFMVIRNNCTLFVTKRQKDQRWTIDLLKLCLKWFDGRQLSDRISKLYIKWWTMNENRAGRNLSIMSKGSIPKNKMEI